MPDFTGSSFFEDYSDEEDEQIVEYDITAAPNDFNVLTIYSFLESGAVRIPAFQRNYVWDLRRASKLIESLILGLPVPQVFLYEADRNQFVVIDGQQRLMSIYYFKKQRFPKQEKRSELRTIFDQNSQIPDSVLHDDRYFDNFRLRLPGNLPHHKNKFNGLSYATLGTYQTQFDLRTIRNVIIKQNAPEQDDSSMYEIFNRLNTGGINLRPQEIRTSMYHSEFYTMLYRANSEPGWRHVLANAGPDVHMKDVEVLLRGFAMLIDGQQYAPSMVRFLNQFSRKCQRLPKERIQYLAELFNSFLRSCAKLEEDAFLSKRNRRFNVALYEATFAAICRPPLVQGKLVPLDALSATRLEALAQDSEFLDALTEGTTQTRNVSKRLERAEAVLRPDA
jgi:uncharacterized protein with ParB-like and HNH nuclease domain